MRSLAGVLLFMATEVSLAGWARFYSENERFDLNLQFEGVRLTREGDLIAGGDLIDDNGKPCNWVARLDERGEILWQGCYESAAIRSVLPTRDEGFLLVGEVGDQDEPPGAGGSLTKLNSQGEVQWQKGYFVSLPKPRAFLSAAVETDSGYIAIGEIEPDGPAKAWILGLDQNGNLLWQKTLTGFRATAIQPTRDGHFLIGGATEIAGKSEVWVSKLDANGQSRWQRTYGGVEDLPGGEIDKFTISDLKETASGEVLVAGSTFDVVSDPSDSVSRSRAWIAKLDRDGHLMWRKVYGEQTPFALMQQVLPTFDGGMLALGGGGDLELEEGLAVWLAKLNADGEIEWQKVYGTDEWLEVDLQLREDGRMLLAGASFFGTRGDWLVELEPDGSLAGCNLASPAAVSSRESSLSERTIAYDETPPEVTVLQREAQVEASRVLSLPACPAAEAFGSCKQIQEAGQSYGSGVYPIALKTAAGPELLGGRCEMQAFGGGWMWIASHTLNDPKPPEDFVKLRFGQYGSAVESFSIWPQVDFSATSGTIGISWDGGAMLLEELSSQELQQILNTSSQVNAWVR